MGRLLSEDELREMDRIRKTDVDVLISELAARGITLDADRVRRHGTMTNLLRAFSVENPAKTEIVMRVGASRWWREVARRRRSGWKRSAR